MMTNGHWPRNDRSKSRARVHRGLLLLLLGFSVFLQGCFIDRLITLRSQTCSFNEHFGVKIDRNLVVELYNPVLLEKDLRLIWGAPPTTISTSDDGSTLSYLFQRVPGEADHNKPTLLDEFNLEFNFVTVNGQPRLSKISSNDLPPELLLTATTISLSGLDEVTAFACQADINPFTRSMILPLDQIWFNEMPSRDELVALLGAPESTLEEGSGLIYQYRLKGSDADKHTANFVIWYDDAGEKPLAVKAEFNRYKMHTDLLTALMKVQIEI
ncbi:MAG: hypothetical protein QNK22_08870 [Xanthomonadales bacterium]|nr:hypothetical protein [Xanthomonadales bacterium]